MGAAADNENEGRAARELTEAGTELAGALVGGAVGTIGGPAGVAAGAFAGVAVQRAARAVAARLSAREAQRAGAALVLIDVDARQRGGRGEAPRDDGFFDERGGLRPDAEELLEGVLRHAANAYEERKVPLLARLYSGTAYDASTPTDDALYLLRLAADLTFRQFVLLAVLAHHERFSDDLARAHGLRKAGLAEPDPALLRELDDLGDKRLVGVLQGARVTGLTEGFFGGPGTPSSHDWGALRLTAAGAALVHLTGAADLDPAEIEAAVGALTGSRRD